MKYYVQSFRGIRGWSWIDADYLTADQFDYYITKVIKGKRIMSNISQEAAEEMVRAGIWKTVSIEELALII